MEYDVRTCEKVLDTATGLRVCQTDYQVSKNVSIAKLNEDSEGYSANIAEALKNLAMLTPSLNKHSAAYPDLRVTMRSYMTKLDSESRWIAKRDGYSDIMFAITSVAALRDRLSHELSKVRRLRDDDRHRRRAKLSSDQPIIQEWKRVGEPSYNRAVARLGLDSRVDVDSVNSKVKLINMCIELDSNLWRLHDVISDISGYKAYLNEQPESVLV